MKYDHIIVGGGPGGMTLATLLPGYNLLLERESTLGGCHRVRRVNGYFTEHGPRIYMTSYVNTINYLKTIGINFYDYFAPYNFQFLNIGKDQIVKTLSYGEIFSFFKEYVVLFFNSNHGKDQTMKEWMEDERFSKESVDYIDRICLLTDGADITRYTLWEFLNLLNQNIFYTALQPKTPNDYGFIKDWSEQIKCDVLLETEALEITKDTVITNNSTFYYDKLILAMPPLHVKQLVDKSEYKPFDEKWLEFAVLTEYKTYVPVTLHFKDKLEIDNIWGLAKESKWGLIFVNLSDYMNINVLSVAITKLDQLGHNNKTANQSSFEEIKQEVYYQLNLLLRFKKYPEEIIVSPGVYKEGDEWATKDNAFVFTKVGYNTWKGKDNVYAISPHAGKSDYAFSSLESAVVNAIWLVGHLYGEKIKLTHHIELLFVLRIIAIILFLILFIYFVK